MARWFFEPGHTSAEFAVRHMMVTEVRGYFKNVHGWMEFDEADPLRGSAASGPVSRSGTTTSAARTFSTWSTTRRSGSRAA